MTPDMGALFVSDRNTPPELTGGKPLPYWNNLFDYYETNPFSQDMVVVDPGVGDRSYSIYQLWMDYEVESTSFWTPAHYVTKYAYERIDRFKVPRQGAYDNVHIAPAMQMRSLKKPECIKVGSKIYMAPLCIHDCLHTHWRWGKNLGTQRHLLGWNATRPYMEAGAPMVPLNQKVSIRIDKPSESNSVVMTYSVEIVTSVMPESGWQIIMHHGSAYGYRMEKFFWDFSLSGPLLSLATLKSDWAEFYLFLRYNYQIGSIPVGYKGGNVVSLVEIEKSKSFLIRERLRWAEESETDDVNLQARNKIRDLGLL
jgi:hypothetical protein